MTPSNETGLTPIQEQAAALLLTGKGYSETARELKIDRSTIYRWQQKANWQAYLNRLCEEIQEQNKSAILSLQKEAQEAIKDALMSKDLSLRFKAATWLVDRLTKIAIGETDPVKIIEKDCQSDFGLDLFGFDNDRYRKLLKENNLD